MPTHPMSLGGRRALRAAACLYCLSALALAQDAPWRLPRRGFAEYDRTTSVWRIAPIQDVRRGGMVRPVDGGSRWELRARRGTPVADGFQLLDYDSEGWTTARLPVRAGDDAWPEGHAILDGRVQFEVPRRTRAAVLTVDHDRDVTAWLNGYEILDSGSDGERKRTELVFTDDQLRLFERRRNILALQVRGAKGGSSLGVELVVAPRPFETAENALARVERDRQQAERLEGSLFTNWRAPAVVHDGELDEDREFVLRPPVDLRDLGAWVAFDLRRVGRGGTVRVAVPLSWRFGEIRAAGRAESTDDDGRQRITLEVEGGKPDARRYEKRFYEQQVLRWFDWTFRGELVVDRWYDASRGVVTQFDTRLAGTMERVGGEDAGETFELEHEESWRLGSVREPRDGAFNEAVVEAIRSGGEFLRSRVRDPGRHRMKAGGEERTYPSGRLALALLAMIHAEVPRDDEVLTAGLDELRSRKLVDTYSVAHAIMALEAYYAPRSEYEELRSGAIDRPRERHVSDADREVLREWTDILLSNMDTRVDPAYLARWNYVGGARYDHSVNQYGLLGLYSAHLCGIEISPSIWRGAAAHLVDSQQDPERRMRLELTSHRQLREIRSGGTTTAAERPAEIAGWGYVEAESNGQPRPIYGSMTCAGLTGLTIALAGMRDTGMARDPVFGEAQDALRMGFAWLAERFTANWHPGPGLHAHYYSHYFYYLYGVERACELSGIALLNGRDWYQEGAVALLQRQRGDGSWHSMTGGEYTAAATTAMAVLFLKKASMPVYTQR